MANEILFSTLADQTLTEALSNQYLMLLADRMALPNHPALFYAGDIASTSSNTIKIPAIGMMAYDLLASTADGAAVANSALIDSSSTVAVARYSKSYEASDLAKMSDSGILNKAMFAQDAIVSGAMTLTSLIANLVDNFATTVGSTGVDATFANFLDALTALEVNKVVGPYMAVLHPVQWGDIRKDLAITAGGAVQYAAASQEALLVRGIGFQGSLCGVDVFTSTYVPTANAGLDRAGGVFGRGAIIWADGTVANDDPSGQSMVIGGKVLFERSRTAKNGLTAYVSHRYLGAAEGIDLCGVSVITDA